MKRWEQLNQQSHREQTLEEQAIGIYTYHVLDRIEHLPICGSLTEAAEELNLIEIYKPIKAWLQEEVETKQ